MRLVAGIVAASVCCFAVSVASFAHSCEADGLAAFHDDFKKPDAQWQMDGTSAYFAGGEMVLKPAVARSRWLAINSFQFQSAVYCLTLKNPADPNPPGDTFAGLLFGKIDNSNFRLAIVNPFGRWKLAQLYEGKWYISHDEKSTKFNQGPGAVNELMIIVQPHPYPADKLDMKFAINGDYVGQPDVWPGSVTGSFGTYAEGGSDKTAEWRFADLTAASYTVKPEGTYDIIGVDARGANYTGVAYVWEYFYRPVGRSSYTVILDIGGTKVSGLGILRGETFSVSYQADGKMQSGLYDGAGTGWRGKRIEAGATAPATETWVRRQ